MGEGDFEISLRHKYLTNYISAIICRSRGRILFPICDVYFQKFLLFTVFALIILFMFSRRTALPRYQQLLAQTCPLAERNVCKELDTLINSIIIFTVSRFHGFTVSRLHGFTASRLHGFTASRLHGFTASRLHGFTATVLFR